MALTDQKKKRLFDKISNQLLLLKENKIISNCFQFDNPYLCPICLREFSEQHLTPSKENYLTLEDAPPDSLGGSKIALTCKECNNTCGHTIDWHLTEAINYKDSQAFYKGSVHHGKVAIDGKYVTVELTAEGDGVLKAYHRIANNNPTVLEKFIYGLKNKTIGPLLNFERPAPRFLKERVNYAIVKANYIITFAKFGYIFLLDPIYNDIRSQLLNPGEVIYPYSPFVENQFSTQDIGTKYITTQGLESIMNIMAFRTNYSETIVSASLNLPHLTIAQLGTRIDHAKKGNVLQGELSRYDESIDLFNDITEIEKLRGWITTRQ
jgi:hypothetical protein